MSDHIVCGSKNQLETVTKVLQTTVSEAGRVLMNNQVAQCRQCSLHYRQATYQMTESTVFQQSMRFDVKRAVLALQASQPSELVISDLLSMPLLIALNAECNRLFVRHLKN